MIGLGNLKEIHEMTVKGLDDLPAFFEDLPEGDIEPDRPVIGSANTELKAVSGDDVREARENHNYPAFFDDLQESNTEYDAPVRSIKIGSFTDLESGEMFEVTLEVDTSDMERYTSDKPIMAERESGTGSKSVESGEGYETPSKNDAGKTSLTEDDKTFIKAETGWSDEIVDSIKSLKEAEIYKKAELKEAEIDGKKCLIRQDIDKKQKDEFGRTNSERMANGTPPLTQRGETIELHHIGQKQNSPLAELTTQEHRGKGNDTVLHDKLKDSEIDRTEFMKERKQHWESRALNCQEEKNEQ